MLFTHAAAWLTSGDGCAGEPEIFVCMVLRNRKLYIERAYPRGECNAAVLHASCPRNPESGVRGSQAAVLSCSGACSCWAAVQRLQRGTYLHTRAGQRGVLGVLLTLSETEILRGRLLGRSTDEDTAGRASGDARVGSGLHCLLSYTQRSGTAEGRDRYTQHNRPNPADRTDKPNRHSRAGRKPDRRR